MAGTIATRPDLNEWVGLASYRDRDVAPGFTALELIEKIPTTFLGLWAGNRFGKDYHISGLYLMKAICGMLPVERFNMRPSTRIRTISTESQVSQFRLIDSPLSLREYSGTGLTIR